MNSALEQQLIATRQSARSLRALGTDKKDRFLNQLADNLITETAALLSENLNDLQGLTKEANSAFVDRLTLTEKRISQMAESLRQVARLADPVGEIVEEKILKNGLVAKRVRAPLGSLLMIFESRPNVITEAFSLAFKSGNVITLRGGSESKNSAALIYNVIEKTLIDCGLATSYFFGLRDYDRGLVTELLARSDLFDIVIPRGGDKLIEMVTKTAAMPIIKNDRGLCHAYVDARANLEMALKIIVNGKVQRPGVCNSLETVLIHESLAAPFLPMLFQHLKSSQVEMHVDPESLTRLPPDSNVKVATPQDWDTEYLDLMINIKVVKDLQAAIAHIERHGSRHSEVIITEDPVAAEVFIEAVDAAAVYWNASTRFTDGFELGLGGELGISTQKLHVRGPVGLRELTTPRWVMRGNGQIRE